MKEISGKSVAEVARENPIHFDRNLRLEPSSAFCPLSTFSLAFSLPSRFQLSASSSRLLSPSLSHFSLVTLQLVTFFQPPFAFCLLPFAFCLLPFPLSAWSLELLSTPNRRTIQPKKLTNSRPNPRFGFTFGLQTISLITACSSQLGNLTQLRQSCQILWGSVALSICRNPCRLKYSGM